MKAILLCNEAANQRALANRLHAVHPLAAIATVRIPLPKTRPPLRRRLVSVSVGLPLRRAWLGMLARLDRAFPAFPDVPASTHEGVNAASVVRLIEETRPDAVLVSGTDLLRQPLLDVIAKSGRVMNLHTGLSPYIKGGPNCTNWALALGEFDLIGNTIMWLDKGIDSGNIIVTERTPLTGGESLLQLHVAVMDHAHAIYCRAYGRLAEGAALPSVPQSDLGPGRLFLTRHWTGRRIATAVANFYGRYGRVSPRSGIRTVELP